MPSRGLPRVVGWLCLCVLSACQQPQSDAHTGARGLDGCVRPEAGCRCDTARVLPCFLPDEQGPDGPICHEGQRHCVDGAWTECIEVSSYPAPSGAAHNALLDDTRDAGIAVPNCSMCDVLCFRATDDLDPADGPLDGSNSSGGTLYSTPSGISLVQGDYGLPPGAPIPMVEGDHPPIVAKLLPGEQVTAVIDSLAYAVNKLDVYFLVGLDDSMDGELANLTTELQGATDYIGATPCVDADFDGSPDPHGTGIVEAARCLARDVWFGAGYFREVPFIPHAGPGEVAYAHLQDLSADADLTEAALSSMTLRDLSSFADVPTSEVVALEALATRDGYDMGIAGDALPAQTSCPAGTRGYPCFRDDAIALIVVLTDRAMHSGPSGHDYAATFSVLPAPDATVDLSAQAVAGTFSDPFDLADVTTVWNRYRGATAMGAESVSAGAVSCGAGVGAPDAVHELTISGLAPGATTPITLSTLGSSFDTVLSIHDGEPTDITLRTVNIGDNSLTNRETQNYYLPDSVTAIDDFDLTVTGGNTTGLGNEVTSNLMGCLGNDARAPDAVYRLEVAEDGTDLTIDTEGSSFDTVIALFEDYVAPGQAGWDGWVEFEQFFPEGWDDWNRNGDGTLCTGGTCNQNWDCDSGSPDKWCGFLATGSSPVIDDLDCTDGATCVVVVNAPGQTVRLDHIEVENDSVFYLKVIDAAYVEIDSMSCEDDSRCGFDYGPAQMADTGDSDLNCHDRSFCYIRHNTGRLVQVEVYNDAVLQLECGADSECGDSSYSECRGDSLCILKRETGSSVNVGMDCQEACICLEGDGGPTGCRTFCGNNDPAVCANSKGQDVLNNGGNSVTQPIQRIACDDDGAPDGVRSRIVTGPLDAGTYYLVVKGKQLGQSGAYNLHIKDTSGDTLLTCNDDEVAGATHSRITDYPLQNGTYYAVVKGTGAAEYGDYDLTVGAVGMGTDYSPPTYADTVAALNAEDLRAASIVTCAASADCTEATTDADTLATDSRAVVDRGAGNVPMSYAAATDGVDVGVRVVAAALDIASYLPMDVALRVVDMADDPSLDPNPYTTTIVPDDATLCGGVLGDRYLSCMPGDQPAFAATFLNPPMPSHVPDNASDPYGAYGFILRMVAISPGVAGAPEYPLRDVPVYIVPNTSSAPAVPSDGGYTQTLEGRACRDDERPDWAELYYKAYLPVGTAIDFRACAGEREADLSACTSQSVLEIEAVANCGGGCPAGSVCASTLPDVTPNDVCVAFNSPLACTVDTDCPPGLSCQNLACLRDTGFPDVASTLAETSQGDRWTRYDIQLRSDSSRSFAPTLDYWHVTYYCSILD